MASSSGIFLALEGTDGSGKATQTALLAERLQAGGYDVVTIDFPRYQEESSYFVRKYLKGDYGSAESVGPYTGSLFYALDRYDAAQTIRQALAEGKIVLADRFTGSNMAHQGAKFANAEERRGYFIWLDNLEFVTMGIPRPTKNFVLRVSADVSAKLLEERQAKTGQATADIHEVDAEHLRKSVAMYDELCQLFPQDFQQIDCVRSGNLMSPKDINNLLWASVQALLPPPTHAPPIAGLNVASKPQTNEPATNRYIRKVDDQYVITTEGNQFLKDVVTNHQDNVYAFNSTLSPTTIAAAMARLSRRGDDMRVTLLDEFAEGAEKDAQLLHRVITAYGDDSVQQLVGLHFVVEKASNLLTKKLEWGRLASYLEQSTRYIYFDRKVDGKYQYHTPEHFDPQTSAKYQKTMDRIFDLYSDMVHKLTDHYQKTSQVPKTEQDGAWRSATRAQACDVARAVLPVATTATVGIYASGQATESLITHLLSDPLPEAQATGQKLLKEARKVIPAFLERADLPERGGAAQAYRANTHLAVKDLADDILPPQHSLDYEPIRLTSFWPRNELDLVPDMLYEHTNLSLAEITDATAKLPYAKKADVFTTYMGERLNRRHKPGRALEKAHYSWDIVCDYGIFRDLQRHRMVDDLEWQDLTARFGYDMPDVIEQVDLADLYEECFDLSAQLYSLLQQNGYELEAQYATLFGHRMRWKVTYNARAAFHLHELRTSPQGHPGYRKLVLQMHEQLAQVHPLLAEAMRFVNQDEDPELTRLAAERYTQSKLEKLNQTSRSNLRSRN